MPRRRRHTVPGVPQHIIQRGNNRQACFFADADYLFYLECLRSGAERSGCAVNAYVLMTNHAHLLITPRDVEAPSRLMQSLGRRYVQYINYTYQRTGTLWEGRYRASLVDAERYYLTCSRYIELNPVRAAMAAHPADYRWSSYRYHAQGEANDLITPHPLYLALGRDAAERQQAYRALFDAHIDAATLKEIRAAATQDQVLGSERFKDQIEAVLQRQIRPGKRGRPKRAPVGCRVEDGHVLYS